MSSAQIAFSAVAANPGPHAGSAVSITVSMINVQLERPVHGGRHSPVHMQYGVCYKTPCMIRT